MSDSRRAVVLDWTRGYPKEWLRPDLVAGLTAAAVVIPKAMAYATIAGLPVQIGLYTALVPMAIYAVLGTSRVLSVSTTTTIAILTAAELGQIAPDGDPATLLKATATLTLLVGAILVLASVLRLGFVANFISDPVLIGFKAGIGLVIVFDQLPKLLGVHIDKGTFFHNVRATLAEVPHTSVPTLAVGVGTLLILLGARTLLSPSPCADRRGGGRNRRHEPPRPAGAGRGIDRPGAPRTPDVRGAGSESARGALARGHGHRADELHRDDRVRSRVRRERGAALGAEPGAARDRARQRRRGAPGVHARRRRHVPDRREPAGRRAHAAVRLWSQQARPCSRCSCSPGPWD